MKLCGYGENTFIVYTLEIQVYILLLRETRGKGLVLVSIQCNSLAKKLLLNQPFRPSAAVFSTEEDSSRLSKRLV